MKINKSNLYVFLIFVIWLVTYLICTNFPEERFEWDEAKYLATANGIAESFDFSSRSTSVLGLIKYGYPQYTTHYPLHPMYLAMFFKLFGSSVKVAHFSTWLSGLITCIFIYLTMLLLTNNRAGYSFLIGISFLFFPRIVTQCQSVMMEIPGCALLSFLIYIIFRGIYKGNLNPFVLAIAAAWLYLYKSLFIGVVIGFIGLIGFFKKQKYLFNLLLFLFTIVALYLVLTKFLFLPLAPWVDFDLAQEQVNGTYADFAGGFFKNVSGNLKLHYACFVDRVIHNFFPYNIFYLIDSEAFFHIIPSWSELGIYFLVFFYIVAFSIISWKSLTPIQRIFISFTILSISAFNLSFISIVQPVVGTLCRYNLIYVPLLTISFGIILLVNLKYLNLFFLEHKKASYFLIISFIFLVYAPYYYSSFLVAKWNDNYYFNAASKNSRVIKKFILDSKPMFIYFSRGTHIVWDLYPTREIFMEATNEHIKKINKLLPKPIEYIFLHPENYLLKENHDLVIKGLPIIDGWYTFYGVDAANKIVVYRLNPKVYGKGKS